MPDAKMIQKNDPSLKMSTHKPLSIVQKKKSIQLRKYYSTFVIIRIFLLFLLLMKYFS